MYLDQLKLKNRLFFKKKIKPSVISKCSIVFFKAYFHGVKTGLFEKNLHLNNSPSYMVVLIILN